MAHIWTIFLNIHILAQQSSLSPVGCHISQCLCACCASRPRQCCIIFCRDKICLSDCNCGRDKLFRTGALVLEKVPSERFVITEKAPTRAFSWLKAATTAFTFKTLLRHYAEWALTPRSLNVKLGPRRKGHKGRAVWLA